MGARQSWLTINDCSTGHSDIIVPIASLALGTRKLFKKSLPFVFLSSLITSNEFSRKSPPKKKYNSSTRECQLPRNYHYYAAITKRGNLSVNTRPFIYSTLRAFLIGVH